MAGFVGADVEQLAALATTFDRRASAFDQIASSSSSALMVAEWTGADVDRLRSEWNRQARPAIQRVAGELRALAVELRRQAEQQREASGGAAPALVMPPLPHGFDPDLWDQIVERIRTGAGNTLSAIDIATLLAWASKGSDFPILGAITGPLGLALGGMDAVDDFLDGDWLHGLVTSGSTVLSGANWLGTIGWLGGAAARLTPLTFGISAGITFVEWTLPTTPDQVDSTYAKGLEHLYGRDADPANLTPEQATAMQERYAGPIGVANMISDTMDATADRIFPWNWGKK